MYHFFIDESYREDDTKRTITVACWAVPQARLNPQGESLSRIFRRPIEAQICSAIRGLDGFALVASACLDKSLCRAGEVDGTDDIPAMARTDNAWTQCTTFAIARLILELFQNRRPVDAVDVFFDPKDLKGRHEEAWAQTLRGLVVSEAKRFAAQLGTDRLRKLKIRHIRAVPKPAAGQLYDKFQIGTWIADKLCSISERINALCPERVRILDMSDEIRRTVQQWDGRSFCDN